MFRNFQYFLYWVTDPRTNTWTAKNKMPSKANRWQTAEMRINSQMLTPAPARVYLVEATYDAFTASTTAFIRFLAACIRDVALSNCTQRTTKTVNTKEYKLLFFRFNNICLVMTALRMTGRPSQEQIKSDDNAYDYLTFLFLFIYYLNLTKVHKNN